MTKHYDMTGTPFAGVTNCGEPDAEGNFPIILRTGADIQEVSNTTFALRIGALTPLAARELYESLDEAPAAFREYLAQYYFDVYGADIHDPWP